MLLLQDHSYAFANEVHPIQYVRYEPATVTELNSVGCAETDVEAGHFEGCAGGAEDLSVGLDARLAAGKRDRGLVCRPRALRRGKWQPRWPLVRGRAPRRHERGPRRRPAPSRDREAPATVARRRKGRCSPPPGRHRFNSATRTANASHTCACMTDPVVVVISISKGRTGWFNNNLPPAAK